MDDDDDVELFMRAHRRRRSIWRGSILGLVGAAAVAFVALRPGPSTRVEDGWCLQERDTPPVAPVFGLEPECAPHETMGGTARATCGSVNFELVVHKFGSRARYWNRDSGKYLGSKETSDADEYCDNRTCGTIRGDIPSERDCDVHAVTQQACGF